MYCEKDHWIDSKNKGHKGANQWSSMNDENQAQKHALNQEELTPQEQEYVQAHDNEIKRNQQVL